jgi:Tol biopolymer transport system component
MDWRDSHDPAQIMSAAVDGSGLRQYTKDDTCHKQPSFADQGDSELLFSNVPCGKGWELVRVSGKLGARRVLISTQSKLVYPRTSPDKKLISFVVVGANSHELKVFDLATRKERLVARIFSSHDSARPQFGATAHELYYQDGRGINVVDPTAHVSRPSVAIPRERLFP